MSQPSRPLCVTHEVEMVAEKSGARVLFYASFGPYEIWRGDTWRCPVGGEEIVTGWANHAEAMHFEPHFAAAEEAGIDVEVPHRKARV